MTTTKSLCILPSETTPVCCDPAPQPPAAPLTPKNPPGLAAIAYRTGTFTSFRQAMLDRVASLDLLPDTTPNPFSTWRPGTDGDYQTMFVEIWAYLADILTFYQERIANEAYLPTATQRDSLRRLGELIGYRPNPGAAASALLAFTAEKGKTTTVPARFRVGSRASPGKPAAVFETDAATVALGDYSAIPFSAVAPTDQFASIASFASVYGTASRNRSILSASLSTLYGSAGPAFLETFLLEPPASARMAALGPLTFVGLGLNYQPFRGDTTTRTIVLEGVGNRLSIGDWLLVVENNGESPTERTLRRISTVKVDKASSSTTITWTEPPGTKYQSVGLHALRISAGAFGNNAPNWITLSPTLNNSDGHHADAPYKNKNWDLPADASLDPQMWSYLPAPDTNFSFGASPVLFLDGSYPEVKGTPDVSNPSWVVVLTDQTGTTPSPLPAKVRPLDGSVYASFHATDSRPVSRANYAISGRVTRLTFSETVPQKTFPLRTSIILGGSETLPVKRVLPLPEPLAGNTVVLAGLFPRLRDGQTVIVRGNVFDESTVPPSQIVTAETAIVAGLPRVDAVNNLTTVSFRQALGNHYVRAKTVLLANVASATQGETVRDEALGSSDGSPLQSYPLKQKPLTYLPSTDPEGLAAVTSTLIVTVNGVRWNEQPTLLNAAADATEFTTTLDDSSQTSVVFGDGVNGARPPTGRDNLHARYRKGMGSSGNLSEDSIQQLVDSVPGVQKATNPQASLGGADADNVDQIRQNAPASVRSFNRAVSATDYASLTLSYPGVAKASASWVLHDPRTLQAIVRPYVQITVATTNGSPLSQQMPFKRKLRSFLDKRRDPNVSMVLGDYTPVYVDVAATIDVDDRYGRQATLGAVQAALNPGRNPDNSLGYFAFERMSFGEGIHLSGVYAALQAVRGVRDAIITTLRRPAAPADPAVLDDIFIRPNELATIANDPQDLGNARGKLTINLGHGGFDDT